MIESPQPDLKGAPEARVEATSINISNEIQYLGW